MCFVGKPIKFRSKSNGKTKTPFYYFFGCKTGKLWQVRYAARNAAVYFELTFCTLALDPVWIFHW